MTNQRDYRMYVPVPSFHKMHGFDYNTVPRSHTGTFQRIHQGVLSVMAQGKIITKTPCNKGASTSVLAPLMLLSITVAFQVVQ